VIAETPNTQTIQATQGHVPKLGAAGWHKNFGCTHDNNRFLGRHARRGRTLQPDREKVAAVPRAPHNSGKRDPLTDGVN